MPIIAVRNLVFDYGLKRALDGVSFSIEEGRVVALVGPNGAGKSTLFRCLTGLEEPVAGSVMVMGQELMDDPRHARRQIGYISDSFGLYQRLTVRQNLMFMARGYDIPPAEIATRVDETIALLDLQPYEATLASSLSRGWRQRVGVGMAIIHRPKLLLLDEPASGLDPDSRARLSQVFETMRLRGTTIIVSSHILSELEDYCTEMLVMKHGRVLDHVKLDKGRDKTALPVLRDIDIVFSSAEDCTRALDALRALPGIESVIPDAKNHSQLEVAMRTDEAGQARLLKACVDAGLTILSFTPRQRKLQDTYLELTQRSAK